MCSPLIAQNRKIEDTPPVPESKINWKSIHNHIAVQRLFGKDRIKLEDGEESLKSASECGISIPWDNGKKYDYDYLTAFCRSHGEIDAKSPYFYRIAPKWPQSVLSYWFRMQDVDIECRDVLRLILTFFRQKNFDSSGQEVYYHWIHRAVHQDANTEHHRRKRQSSFFTELRHHLTTKQRHSIFTSDGIVAVTFEFETDREVTTTFTLFSNGYYRYRKRAHDRCEIYDEEFYDSDYEDKTYYLELLAHYGIWDYKANRIIMEGMVLREKKEEEEEEDDYTDYYESEEEEEEEDPELDDETMSIPEIEGVTYLFDFFRKEMVIEDPLAVRVHVY